MISRHWRGVAKTAEAERYIAHLRTETFPQLAHIAGFVGAQILRRQCPDGVDFRIVTVWESIEALRRFAGEPIEQAVVPQRVRDMMVRFDRTVEHYEIVE